MDVLSIIKQEHRTVASMFEQAEKLEPDDEQLAELAAEIEKELSLHLAIEERLFYAQLRDRAEETDEQVDVFEAYTEHEVAKRLIEMLKSGRKPEERFKAELSVLGESVKHHVQEEESKVFALAREMMDQAELEDIGTAWEQAKQRAQRRGAAVASRNGSRKGSGRKTAGRKSSSRKTAGRKTAARKTTTAARKKTAR